MEKSLEKSIKRFLKRRIKITLGLFVTFLITGVVAFGSGINIEKAEGKNEYTLSGVGGGIIFNQIEEKYGEKGVSGDITINLGKDYETSDVFRAMDTNNKEYKADIQYNISDYTAKPSAESNFVGTTYGNGSLNNTILTGNINTVLTGDNIFYGSFINAGGAELKKDENGEGGNSSVLIDGGNFTLDASQHGNKNNAILTGGGSYKSTIEGNTEVAIKNSNVIIYGEKSISGRGIYGGSYFSSNKILGTSGVAIKNSKVELFGKNFSNNYLLLNVMGGQGQKGSYVNIEDSEIYGNVKGGSGAEGSSVYIKNSTITGEFKDSLTGEIHSLKASIDGGSSSQGSTSVLVNNSIVTGNISGASGKVA